MRFKVAFCFILCILGTCYSGTWTTSEHLITGIEGNKLVAQDHYYDGANWTTLEMQEAQYIQAYKIDNGRIVGGYHHRESENNCGFMYDGVSWTTLTYLDSHLNSDWTTWTETRIWDISGNIILGNYISNSTWHNVIYDGQTWSLLNVPATLLGVEGGIYVGGSYEHGFIYDGSNCSYIDVPNATSTLIWSIQGSNLVGEYTDASGATHGFLYNGANFTTLDAPGAKMTRVYDIDGDTLVGLYQDFNGNEHGFIYTIPEPATMALLGLGGLFLSRRKK